MLTYEYLVYSTVLLVYASLVSVLTYEYLVYSAVLLVNALLVSGLIYAYLKSTDWKKNRDKLHFGRFFFSSDHDRRTGYLFSEKLEILRLMSI